MASLMQARGPRGASSEPVQAVGDNEQALTSPRIMSSAWAAPCWQRSRSCDADWAAIPCRASSPKAIAAEPVQEARICQRQAASPPRIMVSAWATPSWPRPQSFDVTRAAGPAEPLPRMFAEPVASARGPALARPCFPGSDLTRAASPPPGTARSSREHPAAHPLATQSELTSVSSGVRARGPAVRVPSPGTRLVFASRSVSPPPGRLSLGGAALVLSGRNARVARSVSPSACKGVTQQASALRWCPPTAGVEPLCRDTHSQVRVLAEVFKDLDGEVRQLRRESQEWQAVVAETRSPRVAEGLKRQDAESKGSPHSNEHPALHAVAMRESGQGLSDVPRLVLGGVVRDQSGVLESDGSFCDKQASPRALCAKVQHAVAPRPRQIQRVFSPRDLCSRSEILQSPRATSEASTIRLGGALTDLGSGSGLSHADSPRDHLPPPMLTCVVESGGHCRTPLRSEDRCFGSLGDDKLLDTSSAQHSPSLAALEALERLASTALQHQLDPLTHKSDRSHRTEPKSARGLVRGGRHSNTTIAKSRDEPAESATAPKFLGRCDGVSPSVGSSTMGTVAPPAHGAEPKGRSGVKVNKSSRVDGFRNSTGLPTSVDLMGACATKPYPWPAQGVSAGCSCDTEAAPEAEMHDISTSRPDRSIRTLSEALFHEVARLTCLGTGEDAWVAPPVRSTDVTRELSVGEAQHIQDADSRQKASFRKTSSVVILPSCKFTRMLPEHFPEVVTVERTQHAPQHQRRSSRWGSGSSVHSLSEALMHELSQLRIPRFGLDLSQSLDGTVSSSAHAIFGSALGEVQTDDEGVEVQKMLRDPASLLLKEALASGSHSSCGLSVDPAELSRESAPHQDTPAKQHWLQAARGMAVRSMFEGLLADVRAMETEQMYDQDWIWDVPESRLLNSDRTEPSLAPLGTEFATLDAWQAPMMCYLDDEQSTHVPIRSDVGFLAPSSERPQPPDGSQDSADIWEVRQVQRSSISHTPGLASVTDSADARSPSRGRQRSATLVEQATRGADSLLEDVPSAAQEFRTWDSELMCDSDPRAEVDVQASRGAQHGQDSPWVQVRNALGDLESRIKAQRQIIHESDASPMQQAFSGKRPGGFAPPVEQVATKPGSLVLDAFVAALSDSSDNVMPDVGAEEVHALLNSSRASTHSCGAVPEVSIRNAGAGAWQKLRRDLGVTGAVMALLDEVRGHQTEQVYDTDWASPLPSTSTFALADCPARQADREASDPASARPSSAAVPSKAADSPRKRATASNCAAKVAPATAALALRADREASDPASARPSSAAVPSKAADSPRRRVSASNCAAKAAPATAALALGAADEHHASARWVATGPAAAGSGVHGGIYVKTRNTQAALRSGAVVLPPGLAWAPPSVPPRAAVLVAGQGWRSNSAYRLVERPVADPTAESREPQRKAVTFPWGGTGVGMPVTHRILTPKV